MKRSDGSAKRSAINKLHGKVRGAVEPLAHAINRYDSRMVQLTGDQGFASETRAVRRTVVEARFDFLYRNRSPQFLIRGKPYVAQSTSTMKMVLAESLVVVGKAA